MCSEPSFPQAATKNAERCWKSWGLSGPEEYLPEPGNTLSLSYNEPVNGPGERGLYSSLRPYRIDSFFCVEWTGYDAITQLKPALYVILPQSCRNRSSLKPSESLVCNLSLTL